MDSKKTEALKKIEEIFEKSGSDGIETVIVAFTREDETIDGVCLLDNVSVFRAAKMVLMSLIENKLDDGKSKKQADAIMEVLAELLPKEHRAESLNS